jgi:hypothetical protein
LHQFDRPNFVKGKISSLTSLCCRSPTSITTPTYNDINVYAIKTHLISIPEVSIQSGNARNCRCTLLEMLAAPEVGLGPSGPPALPKKCIKLAINDSNMHQ